MTPCPACEAIEALRGAGDPRFVAELRAGVLLLGERPGGVMLAAKHHVAELIDLEPAAREAYLADLSLVMQALRTAVGAERLQVMAGCDDDLDHDPHLVFHVGPKAPVAADAGDMRRRLLRGLLAASPVRQFAPPRRA